MASVKANCKKGGFAYCEKHGQALVACLHKHKGA